MSIAFPSPVLTTVGTLFPGDEVKFSLLYWGLPAVVEAVKPLGNGEYQVVTHRDVGDTREVKARTFHGSFEVWLLAAGDLFQD